ncbi:MAG: hypothetical protein KJP00_09830 [Bacteroidia bacterium]|nr:hypothetical protein [Bacteroidia bacterium]
MDPLVEIVRRLQSAVGVESVSNNHLTPASLTLQTGSFGREAGLRKLALTIRHSSRQANRELHTAAPNIRPASLRSRCLHCFRGQTVG